MFLALAPMSYTTPPCGMRLAKCTTDWQLCHTTATVRNVPVESFCYLAVTQTSNPQIQAIVTRNRFAMTIYFECFPDILC